MNQDFARKWSAALRSGEFKQGFDTLFDSGCHCVVGVACVVAGLPPSSGSLDVIGPGLLYKTSFVDRTKKRMTIVSLNDDERLTFPQLADVIDYEAGI